MSKLASPFCTTVASCGSAPSTWNRVQLLRAKRYIIQVILIHYTHISQGKHITCSMSGMQSAQYDTASSSHSQATVQYIILYECVSDGRDKTNEACFVQTICYAHSFLCQDFLFWITQTTGQLCIHYQMSHLFNSLKLLLWWKSIRIICSPFNCDALLFCYSPIEVTVAIIQY